MQKLTLVFAVVLTSLTATAQPNWSRIKANFTPGYNSAVYNPPHIFNHSVGGWEDGIYISRDGLHMYAFYTPVDIFSYFYDIDTTDTICEFPVIAPYWRGPMIGVDTATVVGGCRHWLHSDVVHASRNNITEHFSPWRPTDINEIYFYEGAPQIVDGPRGTIDAFLYTRTTSEYADIYIMRNVTHNPTDIGQRIDTLHIKSPSGAEDNPHMEHINGATYVLFFDDTYNNNPNIEMYYAISHDSGYTWTPAQPVTSANSSGEETMPHLWFDGTNWWLYYATTDPSIVGNDDRLHIVRRKQTIANDWDSWGPAEIVVSPGFIAGGYGQVFGVGEPTLTQWGDLSFSVVYGDTSSTDTTDVFDSDPWFLPRIGSPLSISPAVQQGKPTLYPNPTGESMILNLENMKGKPWTLILYNHLGQKVRTISHITARQIIIPRESLTKGPYFFHLQSKNRMIATGKIIFE